MFLIYTGILFVIIFIFALWLFFYFVPIGTWFLAITNDIYLPLIEVILMRFRKIPPMLIINQLIIANNGGIVINHMDLEAHYLAGGNIEKVVAALMESKEKGYELTFSEATALDLTNQDIIHYAKNKSKGGLY